MFLRRLADIHGKEMNMADSSNTGYAYPTPGRLFWHRLRTHWKETIAVIRSVADWTVLLYMLIPGALLGGRLYYGLWKEPLPQWSSHMIFGVIPVFLLLWLSAGKMFLMIREADVLFIHQRVRWLRGLMLRGGIYSMIATALKAGAGFLLVLPFMVHRYGISLDAAWCWLLFTVMAGGLMVWLKHFARIRAHGWRRWLLYLPMVVLPAAGYVVLSVWWIDSPSWLAAASALLAVINVLLLLVRMRTRGTFMNDIQEELVQRTKLTGLVLSSAMDKPRKIRSRPWIFRRSQRLFRSTTPVHRLAGACVKAYVRQTKQLTGYAQVMSLSAAILLTLPPGVKILVYAALHLLLAYWLYLNAAAFMKEGFVTMLPWEDEVKLGAMKKAVRMLLAPYALVTSGLLLFSMLPVWAAAVVLIPLALAAVWITVTLLQLMMLRKI